MARMNVGHPWTAQTAANEDAIIVAVERELWRSSHGITQHITDGPRNKHFMKIN